MRRVLTLALVQMSGQLGDQEANLERVLALTRQAASRGANLVVFPELVLTGYNQDLLGPRLVELALSREDEALQRLARVAGEEGVYLVAGFVERRGIPGVLYNSIVFCGPDGQLIDIYAKSHLFAGERLHFRRGESLSRVYSTSFGKVGFVICCEAGYPEIGRILALQGAELLVVPAAWIRQDEDLWAVNLRGRAIDNLVFVAGVDRVGDEGDLYYIGQSMVVNPRGHVLAQLGPDEEEILLHAIDLGEVAMARRRTLYWMDRRPELYGVVAASQDE